MTKPVRSALIWIIACCFGVGLFLNEVPGANSASAQALAALGLGETRGLPVAFDGLAPGYTREQVFSFYLDADAPATVDLTMEHLEGADLASVLDLQVAREVAGTPPTYEIISASRPASDYYGAWLRIADVPAGAARHTYRLQATMRPEAGNEWQGKSERFEITLLSRSAGVPSPESGTQSMILAGESAQPTAVRGSGPESGAAPTPETIVAAINTDRDQLPASLPRSGDPFIFASLVGGAALALGSLLRRLWR